MYCNVHTHSYCIEGYFYQVKYSVFQLEVNPYTKSSRASETSTIHLMLHNQEWKGRGGKWDGYIHACTFLEISAQTTQLGNQY